MKKQELKKVIKPLVKECIQEVLLEEGLLSTIVAEVAKGMQSTMIVEKRSPKKRPQTPSFRQPSSEEDNYRRQKNSESKQKMKNRRQKLMDAIGQDAYNGVNVFEGTDPLTKAGNPDSRSEAPSVLGEDPTDAGVDISSLVADAAQVWKAMK